MIKLALAGYEAKTISPLLRAFGHKLEPDLILGYLGANDINMLTSNNMASLRSFCNYYNSYYLNSNFISPKWLIKVGEYFPHLTYEYGFQNYIKKNFYSDYYYKLSFQDCLKDLNVTESLDNPRIKEIIFKKITLHS